MSEEDKDFSWSKLDEKWTRLVDDHWDYVYGVLSRVNLHPDIILSEQRKKELDTIGWHYRGAMLHGIKHALEYSDNEEFHPFVWGVAIGILISLGILIGRCL